VKIELSLCYHIVVSNIDVKSLLHWWKIHEKWFLNVTFLVCAFFSIPRSKIKTKRTFNNADVAMGIYVYESFASAAVNEDLECFSVILSFVIP
jgi:hypothetical protein